MTTKVLLTHHHRDALENAADRGFWMPLPLEAKQLKDVMYLTSLSYGETLTDGHKSVSACTAMGLNSLGGQGAMRVWGSHTEPIPRGFPRPAPW